MGSLRARTQAETDARRTDILTAAAELFKCEDYDSITLATIAEKTSISRPSVYNYYKTKEEVFIDLLKNEYLSWKDELDSYFRERMTRKEFCKRMTELLFERTLLTKLLSLHQSVIESKCSFETMKKYKEDINPFFMTLADILHIQFPDSTESERDMFRIQFTLFCYSIYPFSHIPAEQIKIMKTLNTLGNLPDPKTVCYSGLLLLSAGLEKS